MAYRDEFPDFDFDVPAIVTGAWAFEDVSWRQDVCPSFVCDVFVLWLDYADPQKRERPEGPHFVLMCEDVVMLETDDFADIRAFVEDGRRDFPAYLKADLP